MLPVNGRICNSIPLRVSMLSAVGASLLFNVPCGTLRDLRGSNYKGSTVSILIFFIRFVMISLVVEFNLFLQLPQLVEKSLMTSSMCEVHSRHDFSVLVIFLSRNDDLLYSHLSRTHFCYKRTAARPLSAECIQHFRTERSSRCRWRLSTAPAGMQSPGPASPHPQS